MFYRLVTFATIMTEEEHIKYWLAESEENWSFAQRLNASQNWVYALIFFHLTLEKLLKGLWINENVADISFIQEIEKLGIEIQIPTLVRNQD